LKLVHQFVQRDPSKLGELTQRPQTSGVLILAPAQQLTIARPLRLSEQACIVAVTEIVELARLLRRKGLLDPEEELRLPVSQRVRTAGGSPALLNGAGRQGFGRGARVLRW